jgi:aconitase A
MVFLSAMICFMLGTYILVTPETVMATVKTSTKDNIAKISGKAVTSSNKPVSNVTVKVGVERKVTKIVKGKKIAPFFKFVVTPASRSIYTEAVKKGVIGTLIEAGAIVNTPACGLCCGRSGGIVSEGERVISSNNRNFLGRMGDAKAEIYLASPASVAAAALEGKIVDPREYL